MITTFYPPYHFGGDAVYVQRLAHGLARRGHEVHVVHDVDAFEILSRGTKGWDGPPPPEGVHVHPLRSRAGWLSPLATQQTGRPFFKRRKIQRLLDEIQPDVTHFHNVSLIGGPDVLRLGRGIRLYGTHEHWLVCPMHVLWKFDRETCEERACFSCQLRGRRPPQWWRWTSLLRKRLKRVDLFLSPSRFTLERHTQWGGLDLPFEVLPYFCEKPPEAFACSGEGLQCTPYFLCVGRLERIKGFQDAIRAVLAGAGSELRIVGTGDYESELRREARGNERIKFLGRCPADELSRQYRGAVATIVPSLCFETFGMVVVESLAHGTPVIARAVGGQGELVRLSGGGLTFANEDELCAAMRDMQADEARRRQHAMDGHRYYLGHWTEEAHLDRYLGLVCQLQEKRAMTSS